MHVIKSHLVPLLRGLKSTTITYGYITRWRRKEFGLEKSHKNDAIAITGIRPKEYAGNSYLIKQVRKKKRSLHQMTPYSSSKGNLLSERSKKNTKEKTINGRRWCLWDKIMVNGVVGFISGFTGTHNFNIRCITGALYKIMNTKQVTFICRNNNWIIQENKIKCGG